MVGEQGRDTLGLGHGGKVALPTQLGLARSARPASDSPTALLLASFATKKTQYCQTPNLPIHPIWVLCYDIYHERDLFSKFGNFPSFMSAQVPKIRQK